ncbi:MAG: alpha-L-fucosidase [Fimbriimonas sp.]
METTRREFLSLTAAGVVASHPVGRWIMEAPMSQLPQASKRVSDFESMAFGMFCHWGLYSQKGRGEWVQNMEGIKGEEYLKLMKTFTAKDFDARKFARAAKRAGMKYITLTSRHHEGFSLYDTRGLSKLDVTHTPCKRDLIREFTDACRKEGIVPMLYCTTLDWNDPRFNSDWDGYLKYLRDSVELLCTHYGKIGGFWFDGNWSKPNADWKESQLYAVIRRLQPEAMIINNTGIDAMGRAGNPEVDSVTFERGRPTPLDRKNAPKYLTSEMCHTMNFHWGIGNRDFNFLSPAHVIEELCFARRAGANLLMNVGPEAQGKLPEYETAALAKVGEWLQLHGGAEGVMYRGRPCGVTGEGEDFALQMGDDLYLFITDLTATSNTQVHGVKKRGPGPRKFMNVSGRFKEARWLDNGESLKFGADDKSLTLQATGYPYGTNTVIRIARLTR